jgi:hypothetical protein
VHHVEPLCRVAGNSRRARSVSTTPWHSLHLFTRVIKDPLTLQLDQAMAKILTSSPQLSWLFLDDFPFHGACWDALASNASVCPDLQVFLWVDCPICKDGRVLVTAGNHDTIRRVVQTRAATLRLAMINPDNKLQSSLILSSYNDSSSNKKAIVQDRMASQKEMKNLPYNYNDF